MSWQRLEPTADCSEVSPHRDWLSISSATNMVGLRAKELPPGRLVVSVSKHLTAVIDGVIHDTHDPSRHGKRCVYGYWQPPDVRSVRSLSPNVSSPAKKPPSRDRVG